MVESFCVWWDFCGNRARKKNLGRTNIDTILCPGKESWCVFGLDSFLGLICNVHKRVVKLKQTNENTF